MTLTEAGVPLWWQWTWWLRAALTDELLATVPAAVTDAVVGCAGALDISVGQRDKVAPRRLADARGWRVTPFQTWLTCLITDSIRRAERAAETPETRAAREAEFDRRCEADLAAYLRLSGRRP